MALTKEEQDELAALEKGEQDARAAEQESAARQHLEAMRMRKRLAMKHGKHGLDFVVVETTPGMNIALRRPMDVEVDNLHAAEEDRAAMESFILSLLIEPAKEEVQKVLAEYCGIATSLTPSINRMMGKVREEEAKK